MKKLLGIVVLSLFFCTNIFAKPVLLECISDDPIFEDEEVKDYLSLDLDKKNNKKERNFLLNCLAQDFDFLKQQVKLNGKIYNCKIVRSKTKY